MRSMASSGEHKRMKYRDYSVCAYLVALKARRKAWVCLLVASGPVFQQ